MVYPICNQKFIVASISIRQLHELSTGKAALTVIIAMIIPVIIMAIIAVFIAMMPGEMFS